MRAKLRLNQLGSVKRSIEEALGTLVLLSHYIGGSGLGGWVY